MKNDKYLELIGFLEELKNIRKIVDIHGYDFLVLVISKYIHKNLGIISTRQQRIRSFLMIEHLLKEISFVLQSNIYKIKHYPDCTKELIVQTNQLFSGQKAPLYYLEIVYSDILDNSITFNISHSGVWIVQTDKEDTKRLASIEEIMLLLDNILCDLDGDSTILVKILMTFLHFIKQSDLFLPRTSGVLL